MFFLAFLMWTYLAGFRPAAYGTEKFMDYGFMEAMMRSTTLPARDLWYSEGHISIIMAVSILLFFSYQAFPYKGGTDLQSYAYLCSRTGFCNAIFSCLPDDVRPYEGTAKSEKSNKKDFPFLQLDLQLVQLFPLQEICIT